MQDLELHDAVVFLAAAGLVIPVVKRLKISPVLGFLLIGLAIGPYGLGRFVEDYHWLRFVVIANTDGVGALAERLACRLWTHRAQRDSELHRSHLSTMPACGAGSGAR